MKVEWIFLLFLLFINLNCSSPNQILPEPIYPNQESQSDMTKQWIQGRGSGKTIELANREAQVDAVMTAVEHSIASGAYNFDYPKQIIRRELNENLNEFFADRRPVLRKQIGPDEYQVTWKFLLKINKIKALVTKIMAPVLEPIKQFSLIFLIDDQKIRSAFEEEFLNKKFPVKLHSVAVEQYNEYKKRIEQSKKQRKKLDTIFRQFQMNGGESLQTKEIKDFVDFVGVGYYAKCKFDYIQNGLDQFGKYKIYLNIKNFTVYNPKTGRSIAAISDSVVDVGETEEIALANAKKKATMVIAKKAFEQIIISLNNESK